MRTNTCFAAFWVFDGAGEGGGGKSGPGCFEDSKKTYSRNMDNEMGLCMEDFFKYYYRLCKVQSRGL